MRFAVNPSGVAACLSSVMATCLRKGRALLLLLMFWPSMAPGVEGETGSPFLRNYTPREYGAFHQNWGMVFDKRGFLYVGNNYGVLEYDGARWRLIPLTNKSLAFSIASSADGRIYVGSIGEIGYLAPDESGEMRHVSLNELIPAEDRAFSAVRFTGVQGRTVCFLSPERLFIFDGSKMKVWKGPQTFQRMASFEDRLFVQDGAGLWERVNDDFKLVIPSQMLPKEGLASCFRLPGGSGEGESWIFGFSKGSLLRWDGTGVKPILNEISAGAGICNTIRPLPGGRIAMATFNKGLVILDKEGRLQATVDKQEGLHVQTVTRFAPGTEGELWLNLSIGLARVELDSPLSRFDERRNLLGNLTSLHRHQGKLYVSTVQGLFELVKTAGQGARFIKIPGISEEAWAFCSWDHELLVASRSGGIFSFDKGGFKNVIPVDGSYCLLRSKIDPQRLYVGDEGGLVAYRNEGGQWKSEGWVMKFAAEPRSLFEDPEGNLWVGTQSMGVYHARLGRDGKASKVEHFGLEQGLPALAFNNVHHFRCGFRVSTKAGIYRLDSSGKRFEPDPLFAKLFPKPRWTYAPAEDAEGRIWMHTSIESSNLNESGAAIPMPDGTYQWDARSCKRFSGSWIDLVMPEPDGVVWFGGPEGLTRLDANLAKPPSTPQGAFVRKVTCGKGRLLFGGLWPGAAPEVQVPYGENTLRFEFALPRFDVESANRYQMFLEGQDSEWSPWVHEPYKEYTNLKEGAYRLRVRAMDLYGAVSREDIFAFEVLSPWYRTWWAYSLYVFASGLALWALIQWRMAKLRQERDALEQKVQERTAELNQVNAIVKSINEKLQFDELLESILKEARVLPGIQKASAIARDPLSGEFHVKAALGWELTQVRHLSFLESELEARYVDQAHEIAPDLFLIRDIEGRAGHDKVAELGLPAVMLVMRVRVENRPEGYFVFENMDDPGAFSEHDFKLLEGLKEHFVSAFLKARSMIQLEHSLEDAQRAKAMAEEARLAADEARQIAEEATKSKSEFLANMSHELRTPMNAIIGFSTLSLKMEIPGKLRDYVHKISTSAQSLLGLINDILDFSKIEAGKLTMEAIPFELPEVLSNVADLFAMKASDKNIELIISGAPDVPSSYIGDPLRLSQVLINLVNNALKFTQQGFVSVRVDCLEKIGETARLHFRIQDSGIGMTPEQLSKLFQAFSQADASTTRKYGGTGLGLTISKKLVEMMGGEIGVDSEAGVGSCFHFTIELPLEAGRHKPDVTVPEGLKTLHVLVVDDTNAAREVLAEQLGAFHFEVKTVASGEEALHALETAERPFDLVLTDYQMPGMDGLETIRRIQSHPNLAKMPSMVMVSAFGREEVMGKAHKLGAKGFLIKPVNPSLLFDTILQALGYQEAKAMVRSDQKGFKGETLVRGAYVLLAEDNEINQQVATEILGRAGVRIDIANNGREAVEMVDRRNYDAVLMDVQMPEMDGYQATRAIREKAQHQGLPIIAMTAHAMAGYREECLAVGMNDYVTKPINPDQLFTVLASWVKVSELSSTEDVENGEVSVNENAEKLEIQGVDVDSALARLGGNQGLLVRLLKGFASDFKNAHEELEEVFERGDLDGASQLLHSLRGSAGNLGAMELSQWAQKLEDALHQEELAQFRASLPEFGKALASLCQGAAALMEPAKTETKAIPATAFGGSALIADDNQANRFVAEALVGRHGLRVRSVEDGQAALELLENEHFEIVFLDGHMPRLDGPSTLKEIRRREQGIWRDRKHIVIALTGLNQPGDRKRLLELGFDDYLPKPLEETELQRVLERHMNALEPLQNEPFSAASKGDVDWDRLAQALGGRDGLLEFLAVFTQDSEERQTRMHAAFADGDRVKMSREAHDLKSNAATLGFTELSDLCKGIEREALGLMASDLESRLSRMDALLTLAWNQCQSYSAQP